ncbi:MAG: hypothetical protein LBE78_00780, partial [Burkholderiaceae bacterium]|nr:hypothetical protein [Burkholderiaceae bacterium]
MKLIEATKTNVHTGFLKITSGGLPFLVLRSIKTFPNEIDGFVRQARRKAQQYRVVLRAFATQHGGQRRDFMSMFW